MKRTLVSSFLTLLAVAAVLLAFTLGLRGVREGSREQGREQLEDALRRAAVACYAAEGIYPPTLEYLEEHYGVQVDRERYTVVYDIFASNLMPDVTVLEHKP